MSLILVINSSFHVYSSLAASSLYCPGIELALPCTTSQVEEGFLLSYSPQLRLLSTVYSPLTVYISRLSSSFN